MNNPTPTRWPRRSFLGGALVGAGAVAGWLVRRWQGPETRPAVTSPAGSGNRFEYDVSEFEETDPRLLRYSAVDEFPTGLDQVTRLAHWPGHGIVLCGDRAICIHDSAGRRLHRREVPGNPGCLLAAGEDELWVGFPDRLVKLDAAGGERLRIPLRNGRTRLTGLTAHEDRLYAADAGNREVLVIDRTTGDEIDRFGKKDPARGNPGFNVPSPYFALAVAPDARLRIVNPGWLRIETYTLDGRFVSAWGGPGMQIDRFCGCCNPVYFTMTRNGEFITSEKGLARINVYDADGGFVGAVAGPSQLVTDKALAKRACQDCSVGAGFDVAVAPNDDVLALDPFRKTVRRFRPLERS